MTGLLLQLAIGPVFFFILNLALQRTIVDGVVAVIAVTIVDYIFITLAVLGVGKLLDKPKIKLGLGIASSVVLALFGIIMILKSNQNGFDNIADVCLESSYIASFTAAFLLTISSPLTIVFWTGLFATRAIEKGYTKNELLFFGIAAGLATLIFLGASVTLLSIIRTSIPIIPLRTLNSAVGLLLIGYGIIRLLKIALERDSHNH